MGDNKRVVTNFLINRMSSKVLLNIGKESKNDRLTSSIHETEQNEHSFSTLIVFYELCLWEKIATAIIHWRIVQFIDCPLDL